MSSAGALRRLIVVLVAALRYRDRARQWLDQRFFREEYDARKILRLARQPGPLRDRSRRTSRRWSSARSTRRCTRRWSRSWSAGSSDGRLVPVTVLHGSADSLPLEGGLGGDAAVVGRAAGRDAARSALAGAAAARRTSRNGCTAPAPPCWCRWSAQDRALVARHRARRAAFRGGLHRRGLRAARQHRRADGARLRRRAAAPPGGDARPISRARRRSWSRRCRRR